MPTLNKAFSLEITVEQFLKQCSVEELNEVDMLMQSNWVQDRMQLKKHINPAFGGIRSSDGRCLQCDGDCVFCIYN